MMPLLVCFVMELVVFALEVYVFFILFGWVPCFLGVSLRHMSLWDLRWASFTGPKGLHSGLRSASLSGAQALPSCRRRRNKAKAAWPRVSGTITRSSSTELRSFPGFRVNGLDQTLSGLEVLIFGVRSLCVE